MTAEEDTAEEAVAQAAADPEGRRLVQAILDRKAHGTVHAYLVPKDLKVGDTVQYLGVVARH